MALTRELQVFKDSKSLMTEIDKTVVNMKRTQKFNIGNRMFLLAMDISELIGHANRLCGQMRKDTLNIVLEKLDHLDFLIEYCLERNYIQLRVSSNIAYYIDKITKLTIGWRNYTQK